MQRILLVCFILLGITSLVLGDPQWITLDPNMQDSIPDLTLIVSDEDSVVLELEIPGFYWDTTRTRDGVLTKYVNFARGSDSGISYSSMGFSLLPSIPRLGTRIIVPPQDNVFASIETFSDTSIEDFLINPSEEICGTTAVIGFDSFYVTDDTFPEEPARVGNPYILSRTRSVSVNFYPIRYIASDTSLLIHKKIRVKIEFSGIDTTSFLPDTFYKFTQKEKDLNCF